VSRFAHIVKAEMLPKNAAWIRDNVDEAPKGANGVWREKSRAQ
jgi:hypothetical protein